MKCTRDLAKDPAEDSQQKWLQLIPKMQQLAAKESETRTAIKERQEEEIKAQKLLVSSPFLLERRLLVVFMNAGT